MERETIKKMLHESNFRLTNEREAVLMVFMTSETMLTPGQLHAAVREKHQSVGLTTVYRLLEVLTKLGLATPFLVDGEIYYTFCTEEHHHHFVCLACHKVMDLYHCPTSLESYSEFGKVDYHRMDLYGQCNRCKWPN